MITQEDIDEFHGADEKIQEVNEKLSTEAETESPEKSAEGHAMNLAYEFYYPYMYALLRTVRDRGQGLTDEMLLDISITAQKLYNDEML